MLGLGIWQVAGVPSLLGSPQCSRRDALGAETQVLSTPHSLFSAGFKGRWVPRDRPRSRRDRSREVGGGVT